MMTGDVLHETYQSRRKTTPFKGWISGEFT